MAESQNPDVHLETVEDTEKQGKGISQTRVPKMGSA